jgi:tetratricopeptide (TPR) repeat protein
MRKRSAARTLWVPVLLVLLAGSLTTTLASSSGGGSRSGGSEQSSADTGERDEADLMYARGMELVAEGKYEDALGRFEKAHKKRKKDPEILNMLAYTQRKIGKLEDAFENYQKALKLEPEFPQAREYLGEAHIQAALLQVEILRGYGPAGKEELDELVAALQRAAETLSAEAFADPAAKTGGDW